MKVFFWGEPQRGFVIGALRRMGEVRRGYGEKTGTKFPSASSQPSCYIPPLSFFLFFFLLPSFLSPSFHPSLPHIHDPVINLVEISRSLINACLPSSPLLIFFPLAVSFSFDCIGFWVFIFFSSLVFLSVAFFSVFLADENEVMCSARGVREEDWVALPPLDSLGGPFFKLR